MVQEPVPGRRLSAGNGGGGLQPGRGQAPEGVAASRGCALPASPDDAAEETRDVRLRGSPAAQQRGRWLAGQRAGAIRQLHDDRVLVERGPDQAVR
jgi:hypothetical protein